MSSNQQQEEKLIEWAVDTLKASPGRPLPEGFLVRFQENLENEKASKVVPLSPSGSASRPKVRRLLRTPGLVAAVLLFCLGALYWFRPTMAGHHDTGFYLAEANDSLYVDGIDTAGHQAVQASQILSTSATQGAVLKTSDEGNRIALGPDTVVAFQEGSASRRRTLKLSKGAVSIGEQSLTVAVSTPELIIVPLGTEYTVERVGDATQVMVYSGRVRVDNRADGSSRILEADQGLNWKHAESFKNVAVRSLSKEQREMLDSQFSKPKRSRTRPDVGLQSQYRKNRTRRSAPTPPFVPGPDPKTHRPTLSNGRSPADRWSSPVNPSRPNRVPSTQLRHRPYMGATAAYPRGVRGNQNNSGNPVQFDPNRGQSSRFPLSTGSVGQRRRASNQDWQARRQPDQQRGMPDQQRSLPDQQRHWPDGRRTRDFPNAPQASWRRQNIPGGKAQGLPGTPRLDSPRSRVMQRGNFRRGGGLNGGFSGPRSRSGMHR